MIGILNSNAGAAAGTFVELSPVIKDGAYLGIIVSEDSPDYKKPFIIPQEFVLVMLEKKR